MSLCHKRNYAYYRRFFVLPEKYYHNTPYYSNIDSENYYSKLDSEAKLDIKGRSSTLCFLSSDQMKTKSLIGPSGIKLTKNQKFVMLSKELKKLKPPCENP